MSWLAWSGPLWVPWKSHVVGVTNVPHPVRGIQPRELPTRETETLPPADHQETS